VVVLMTVVFRANPAPRKVGSSRRRHFGAMRATCTEQ
jgi:hypothetical protein